MFRRIIPILSGRISTPSRTTSASIQSHQITFPSSHRWDKTMHECEKLVGFTNSSFVSLQALMNDDATSLTKHMRKLLGSGHPFLKTLKRLIYYERDSTQVRGLFTLLLSRAANDHFNQAFDFDPESGVLERQRRLSEIIEMIYSAQCIHKSVMNLPTNLHEEPNPELKEDLLQLEYGNKIAILGGDYLLANACTGLAALRNTHIVEIISIAIAEFTQSEFLGQRDIQGRAIPTSDTLSLDSWTHRNALGYGSLLANGCQSALMLGELSDEDQQSAYRFGFNMALALQAYFELEPFTHEVHQGMFDLSAAPVAFHLQNDPELLAYIQDCENNVENLDFKKIFREIVNKQEGLQLTHELCKTHANRAQQEIEHFADGRAKECIKKFISILKGDETQ